MAAPANTPTLGRLLLVNGAAIVAVFCFLALTPAPVTFPDSAWESALLLTGAALLLMPGVLVARVGDGIAHPSGARTNVASDPLVRMRWYEHYDVVDETGVIGIVDQTIGDPTGRPVGLIAVEDWSSARRFFVPLREIHEIDDEQRTISVIQASSGSAANRTDRPRTL